MISPPSNVERVHVVADEFNLNGFKYACAHNFSERLAVAPAKWKLEFKKDVIAGCH
jgi:hypothetical protein